MNTQCGERSSDVEVLVRYFADDLGLGLVWLCGPACILSEHRHDEKPNSRGKIHLVPDWQRQRYQSAAELLAAKPPGAVNFGIRTGFVAGARRLVIGLDLDRAEHIAWVNANPELHSPVLRTRGTSSQMRIFRFDGEDRNEQVTVAGKKLCALVRDKHFVAPGCMHPTGAVYAEAAPWTPELLDAAPRFPRAEFLAACARLRKK